MTRQRGSRLVLALAIVGSISLSAVGVRWSPAELDLEQDPGTQETYRLLLTNDADEPITLSIRVGDWLRDENGINDFGVPLNGARWESTRRFSAGETVDIRYAVQLPDSGEIDVQGTFRSWSPQLGDSIVGSDQISPAVAGDPEPYVSSLWTTMTRSVESVDASGLATIRLRLRIARDSEGLTVEESFSQRADITSLDTAADSFDTVNRSNADWISLSHSQVDLDPNETREILMTVTMPSGFSGTSWSIIHAESRSIANNIGGGTQIVSLASVGMKVFVTAPGTEILAGDVTYVREQSLSPLALEASFTNAGNVQLVVNGRLQIIDQTGETIRDVRFAEYGRDYFRVLPDSQRTIVIADTADVIPLPVGVYQAVFSFDFGGDRDVAGVRAFRVR